MESWWAEIDDAVLSCLAQSDAMTTKEIARRLGMSDEATRSVLALLAQEGRVDILAVAQRGSRAGLAVELPVDHLLRSPDDQIDFPSGELAAPR